ncbi:hypothetical protein GCM10020370_12940 [Paenibacillus hodogayensis]
MEVCLQAPAEEHLQVPVEAGLQVPVGECQLDQEEVYQLAPVVGYQPALVEDCQRVPVGGSLQVQAVVFQPALVAACLRVLNRI